MTFWTLHFLSLTVTALWLAWWLLTPLDFGFAWGYRLLDIPAHIQTYASQNIYKHGYETTTEQEHVRQFSEIVTAINHQGKGLAEVQYQGQLAHPVPLLREPEIIHLQDVADLVSLFHWAGKIALILWIGSVVWILRNTWSLPHKMQILAGIGSFLAVLGITVLAAGPTTVFYWLHTHIFPENHQWFFYYQESLMTTLMKAPDLFGFIAVLWIGLSLLLFTGCIIAVRAALNDIS